MLETRPRSERAWRVLLLPLSSQPGGLDLHHLLHDLRQVLTIDGALLKTGVNKHTLVVA